MIAFKRLDSTDHIITPFETNKQWIFDEQSDEVNIVDGVFYKGVFNPSEPQNSNGLYKRTVWHFINQLYYEFDNQPYTAFGPVERREYRQIHGDVRVISFGQEKIGEGILTGSFKLVHHPGQGDEITLVDDGYGNLVDSAFDTGSAPSDDDLIAFWSFNEGYKSFKQEPIILNQQPYNIINFSEYRAPSTAFDSVGDRNFKITGSEWVTSVFETGLSFPAGINTSEANFSGSLVLNNRFTLNYWANVTGSGTIIGLKDDDNGNHIIQDTGSVEIFWGNGQSNTFNFTGSYSNQTVMTTITAKRSSSDSNQYHLEFFENGNLVETGSQNFFTSFEFDNIGNSNSKSALTGSIDELRVYNKALTASQSLFLYNNPSNQRSIGNVFYDHGVVTLTNKIDKYNTIASGSETFALSYKSTHTIYEHEFHCKIDPGDFNMTMNPTSRTGSIDGGPKLKENITGSNWDPYISSVGLYDDLGRLIVVGKLARPIKNDSDVPKTIVLRVDF